MSERQKLNIAEYLPAMAEAQPDALAVVVQRRSGTTFRYEEWTARQLDDESNRLAAGLRRIGIADGMRTVLMVTPSLDFFALTFALFKAGAIPVMVDPGMGVRNLRTCLDDARPGAFVGISKAHAARVIFRWARRTNTKNVTVGRRWFWGGATLQSLRGDEATPVMAATGPDDLAAILFTSGSTGVPKGAEYTHGIFDAQVSCLRDEYGIEPGERDLATFPLFALFGPALGMAAIVPDMDASRPITADPNAIISAIRDYNATNIFASPALIEKVGRYGKSSDVRLPSVRRVISAGAPADPKSLERFATMLSPGVPVMPSYGATEALPVAAITHTELIEETILRTERGGGICIGRPIGEVAVKIIRISDAPVEHWEDVHKAPEGEIGEICVSGPVVTRAYFDHPDATRLSKIQDEDGRVWHRMGDVGYFDDQDRIWFCGRKAHRVVTETETLFTIPCERVFNTHPSVRRTALVGVTGPDGTRPVLCVELAETDVNRDEVTAELRSLAHEYPVTRNIDTFLFHSGFPTDVRHNAKIFREMLAVWAQEELA